MPSAATGLSPPPAEQGVSPQADENPGVKVGAQQVLRPFAAGAAVQPGTEAFLRDAQQLTAAVTRTRQHPTT